MLQVVTVGGAIVTLEEKKTLPHCILINAQLKIVSSLLSNICINTVRL